MILKQLRLSRHLSQDQLATMSGLNVRTIQRIESGHKASVESLKCLAAVLEVELSTLNQEKFVIDKQTDGWSRLPILLKWWIGLNFLNMRPSRRSGRNIVVISHVAGFVFCLLGLFSRAALEGGLMMLANAYLFTLLNWQGDKYGIWFDPDEPAAA